MSANVETGNGARSIVTSCRRIPCVGWNRATGGGRDVLAGLPRTRREKIIFGSLRNFQSSQRPDRILHEFLDVAAWSASGRHTPHDCGFDLIVVSGVVSTEAEKRENGQHHHH